VIEEKPFTIIPDGNLDRTAGIKATVSVIPTPNADQHEGKEVTLFQLMKGTTPINIIALEEEITGGETYSARFNVADYQNSLYAVKVFVFDRFDSNINAPENLAEPVELQ